MSVTLYPVAETAEGALHTPRGFAARESEARACAAQVEVRFAVEPVGPIFADREAAQAAYAGGRGPAALSEGWARLTPVAPASAGKAAAEPVRPTYADGRRWPRSAVGEAPTQWRLWVSYWRICAAGDAVAPDQPARRLRRSAEGQGLAGPALNALARQPLRAVRPQQPLDIGLFEARRPEEPDLIIPDE